MSSSMNRITPQRRIMDISEGDLTDEYSERINGGLYMPRVSKVSIDRDHLMSEVKRKTRKNEADSIARIASVTGKSLSTVRKWLNSGEMPTKAYHELMAYLDADTTGKNDNQCEVPAEDSDVETASFTFPNEFTYLVEEFAKFHNNELVGEFMKCLRDIYVAHIVSGGQKL